MKHVFCKETVIALLTFMLTANHSHAQHDHHSHDHQVQKQHLHEASKKSVASEPPMTHNMASHDMDDDPLITMVKLDQLEWRNANQNEFAWDAEAWLGYDTNKLWVKTEGEKTADNTEHSEIQLLYSRSVSAFWDFQTGLRIDIEPESTRNWIAFGLQGLAPYFIEVDSALFFGESGDLAYRLKLEQEWLLTQKLALVPKIELKFYGQNDREYEQGSGLSETEIGLRLQYQIKRNIAPYIGVHTFKKHGNTAAYARDEGEETDDAQLLIGLHAWF